MSQAKAQTRQFNPFKDDGSLMGWIPLEWTRLPARRVEALKAIDVCTVHEARAKSDAQLLSCPGFGPSSLTLLRGITGVPARW